MAGSTVVDHDCLFESVAPKFGSDNSRPKCHGMEKHGLSMGHDDTNVAFNNTILPMSTNAAIGMRLVGCITVISECL